MLITSRDIIRRMMQVDLQYTIERMAVIAARPGNPFGIEVKTFDGATALLARKLPSPRFNRVVGLDPAQVDLVATIHEWYASNDVKPRFEVRPEEFSPALGHALAGLGYFHSGFHASLYGPVACEYAPARDVTIRHVTTAEEMERFLDVYVTGWDLPEQIREPAKSNMRGWLDQRNWFLYQALVGSEPAAVAMLYMHDGIGYFADATVHPAFRGRHIQGALLAHRWEAAANMGAELVYSQAEYNSASYHNLERAGMRLLHTQAEWTALG
jgi:ribosomal protein S18 acetylase RimI-like enzyme